MISQALPSILVYTVTALLLFAFGAHASRRERRLVTDGKGELPFYCWEMVASVLLVTLMMALRYRTGSDWVMYCREFTNLQSTGQFTRDNFEPGFRGITWLLASSGAHYAVYFGFWAFLQMAFLYFGLRHRKFLLPWIGALLILGPYSYDWLTFMRQWVVCMMLVPMCELIEKRKFWWFLLLTLVACTIHRASWILLILYFVPRFISGEKSPRFYLAILAGCIILGIYPFWIKLFAFADDISSFLGYGKYTHHLADLFNGQLRVVAWGPLHILNVALSVIVCAFYPRLRRHFKDDALLPIYFSLAFVGSCYQNLLVNTNYYMLRPAEYTFIFILIVMAYVLNYLYQQRQKWALVATLAVSCAFMYANVVKEVISPSPLEGSVIYQFFFLS